MQLVMQTPVGVAEDSVAGRLHLGVAGSIALEGCAVGVGGEAVQLDDEAVARPVGVYLVVED